MLLSMCLIGFSQKKKHRKQIQNNNLKIFLSPLQSRALSKKAVLRIRIHMFLGLPDPDPLVRGMDPDPFLDPDPSIIMQK